MSNANETKRLDSDDRLSEGFWRVLAKWFLVPRTAPILPGNDDDIVDRLRPAPGWLRYGRVSRVILFGFLFVLALAIVPLLIASEPVPGLVVGSIAFPLILVFFALTWIGLHLAYASTWYVLGPRSMRLRRGMLIIHEETITFENVQDVAVSQGPLQRYFGISDLVVKTAGGGGGDTGSATHRGVIAGIEDAAGLRERIMAQVRASGNAGLGDEHDDDVRERVAHAVSRGGFGPEHVAVLREIRELVSSEH